MANPDTTSGLSLELLDEDIQITLTFASVDDAQAAFDRMAAALRAGTGFTIGRGKPAVLTAVGDGS